jgi:Methylase involved in ubiquinone/menaquinone biosynthesis
MKDRYNAAGYHPMIDYRNKEYNKNIESLKTLLQNLISHNIKVLDLGCNAGKYSFFIEELGAHVTGIDFSDVALNIAREIGKDIDSNCIFIEDNILDMHFKDNSFDLAIFPLNIVEFQYDDIEVLCKELKNILSANGVFCVTMQDAIKRIQIGRDSKDKYDLSTGIHKSFHDIPDKGMYEYQTYFWTLAFAKHIIGKYFTLLNEVEYGENRHWLEFKNIK